MNEIARIKNEVRLKQWAEMVRQRNESGLNVSQWCRQNGINQKTYYYRLNRVRKALCGEVEKHEIVPVSTEPEIAVSHEQISLSVGNVVVNLPDDFNEDTLKRLLGVLVYTAPTATAARTFCHTLPLTAHGHESEYPTV